MSRSYHQHHRTTKNKRQQGTVYWMLNESPHGRKLVRRKRKTFPFGSIGVQGYGGERYYPAIGEVLEDIVKKTAERMRLKRELYKDIQEYYYNE